MKNNLVHMAVGFVFGGLYFLTGAGLWQGALYLFCMTLYIEGMQWVLYDKEPKLLDRFFDIMGYMAGGSLAAGIVALLQWAGVF